MASDECIAQARRFNVPLMIPASIAYMLKPSPRGERAGLSGYFCGSAEYSLNRNRNTRDVRYLVGLK